MAHDFLGFKKLFLIHLVVKLDTYKPKKDDVFAMEYIVKIAMDLLAKSDMAHKTDKNNLINLVDTLRRIPTETRILFNIPKKMVRIVPYLVQALNDSSWRDLLAERVRYFRN